jgi:hypothetical protein
MSVATVKAQLATLQEQIAGVNRAYVQGPLSLPATDLPAFVNYTSAATHEWRVLGAETDRETRQYLMRLYVCTAQDGIEGEAERRCEPFFASVRNFFAAHLSLGQLRFVEIATLLGDSGVRGDLAYAGEQFIGIEFRLQVIEHVPVTFAANE